MSIESILASLGNYFANPIGLAAVAALIPLAIFYLIKREPEEKMMPSFMFFHDQEESSTARSSYRKLMKNLVLLLHALAIIFFALAFAEPLMPGAGEPDHSVLVIDHSGSINGDLADSRQFLKQNLGNENTVIAVDDDAEVLAEKVGKAEARSIINSVQISDTTTGIASALQNAQRYEGAVFVGSDLDQTATDTDVENIVEDLRSDGNSVELMETSRRNSWGIIGLNVGRENTTVDIKNFESRSNSLTVEHDSSSREIDIQGETVKSITLESIEGRNTVRLSDDGFSVDNKAYFSVPESSSFDVVFIADEENRYLAKAFELIEFTDFEYRRPPVEGEIDADMYVVGETERMISETSKSIAEEVENGASLVLFGGQDFSELGFENLPVEELEGHRNTSLSLREPLNIDLGETRIKTVRKTRGEILTSDSNALIRSSYGSGEFLLYNVPDEVFNQNFLYPVFWKEVSSDMLDRESIEELNYRTGKAIDEDSILTPGGEEESGRTELKSQGFYNTSRGVVAANMLNEDESLRDRIDLDSGSADLSGKSSSSVQNYVMIILLGLILIETGYLYRIGDLR